MRHPFWAGDPSLVDDLAAAGYPVPRPQLPPGYPGGRAPFGYQAAGMQASGVPYRRIMPQIPGAPALGFRDQAVGLGTVTFTATSGLTLNLNAQPGRPFKARRPMFDTTRVGATATGLLTITTFFIGDSNQLVGTGPLLVAAYAPGAFGADGQFSACAPALTIRLGITTSLAPTAPDNITVGGQLNGETIGA